MSKFKSKKPMKPTVFTFMAVLFGVIIIWGIIRPGAPSVEEIAAQDKWVEERMPGKGIYECGEGNMWDRLPANEVVWREGFRKELIERYWDDVPEQYTPAASADRWSPESSEKCIRRTDLAMKRVYIKERTPELGVCAGNFWSKKTPLTEAWRDELREQLAVEYDGIKKPYVPFDTVQQVSEAKVYAAPDSALCRGDG